METWRGEREGTSHKSTLGNPPIEISLIYEGKGLERIKQWGGGWWPFDTLPTGWKHNFNSMMLTAGIPFSSLFSLRVSQVGESCIQTRFKTGENPLNRRGEIPEWKFIPELAREKTWSNSQHVRLNNFSNVIGHLHNCFHERNDESFNDWWWRRKL